MTGAEHKPQKTPTARLNDLGTRLALLDQAAGVSMTTGRVQFGAAWDIAVEALVEARALVEQLEALQGAARVVVQEFAADNPFVGYAVEALADVLGEPNPMRGAPNPASVPENEA